MAINFFEYGLKIFLSVGIIFYCPVVAGTTDPIEFGYLTQELFFRYGVITLFFLSQLRNPIRALKVNSFPILGIFLIASAAVYGFTANSRHGILNIFFWMLLYKLVYEHFNFAKIKSFAWVLGWVLFVNLAWCALQMNGHDFLYSRAGDIKAGFMDTIVGLMRLKVFLGILSAILFPFILAYAPAFVLCVIPLLYFGVSSASMAAFVVSSLVMAWLFLPRKYAVISSLVVGAVGTWFVFFYDMPNGQFGERFKVWEGATALVLKANPILGLGIGSFNSINFTTIQSNNEPLGWNWVHNEFIQGFFEMGAIGMAIIFSYFCARYKEFKLHGHDPILKILFCVGISILIISFFHFPLHLGRFTHLIAFFFAIFHARVEDVRHA